MPRNSKSSSASSTAAAQPYLRPEALTFLRNLARHNDRAWFQPRKEIFEAELKEPMLSVVRKITDAMVDFAVAYADQTEHDHEALATAVRSGRLAAQTA